MNKTAIRNYAVWARSKLIADIEYKAGLMGITENGIASALPQSTNEVQFFDIGTKDYASIRGREINQRNALISAIRAKEKESDYKKAFLFVVEKVAYTWFNRLVAIRFMEVNDYLPSRVRVLSSENENKAEPDMVTSPFDTDMSFSQQEEDLILKLKDENRLNELFRWLFIKQCHKLHDVLPLLFSPEMLSSNQNDYFELLLTISFTDKDGVLWHLVHDIREQDFRIRTPEDDERQRIENIAEEDMPAGQVEIIGWMYQYYNTEPKDQVFADLKKNIKISKDKIPAATQLFTPDWIVRYMVENSLGRLWVEGHPNEELKKNWKYYLEEAEQEPEVQKRLAEIRREYAVSRPEEIKVIDPCMGSGHILVYLFEVLMQIYESQGWTQREAAQSIVQNNLYGLDIDERAAQLAYFAVMMKARQYDRRFLERSIEPHVYEIRESNSTTSDMVEYFANGDRKLKKDIETLISDLRDAKEYGSVLNVTQVDFPAIYARFEEIQEEIGMLVLPMMRELLPLVKRAEVMAQEYEIIVTNPPYIGNGNMDAPLADYMKEHFPFSKSDICTVFIEKCSSQLSKFGLLAMMTSYTWMFLGSFEDMRRNILQQSSLASLIQPEYHAFFEEAFVPICTFTIRKNVKNYMGKFVNLSKFYGAEIQGKMALNAIQNATDYLFLANSRKFNLIPGSQIAYWISDNFADAFKGKLISDFVVAKKGLSTGDINRFARFWFEVAANDICYDSVSCDFAKKSGFKWFPYIKGGAFRRWGGNKEYIVNWENDGFEIKNFVDEKGKQRSRPQNVQYYFRKGITYSAITTYKFSTRFMHQSIFGGGGDSIIPFDDTYFYYVFAFLNSKIAEQYFSVISPTMNYEVGHILSLPLVVVDREIERVNDIVANNIAISNADWDDFETSWDFMRHPLVRPSVPTVSDAYLQWKHECEERFNALRSNEEKLNCIFIDIYALQDELTPEVENKDVTVRQADIGRDIRSFISYAVGCMFGRYSLDVDGLVYAGGAWNPNNYTSFIPDEDNCIPVTDDSYFKDDIVSRFVEFIRVIFGDNTLEENLVFIAKALGNKGNSSREVIRNYFLSDFMKDHIKVYQKRPIYWLFDSGKQNGFKALVYMHRWNADTIGNLRVEYLHRMQRVYEKEITRMQDVIDNSHDNREINQATKRREKLVKQLKEARDYDAKIAHAALSRVEIDLDDGVKVNYEKVQKGPDGKSLGILAKI